MTAPQQSEPQKQVLILGAGVTGLQTALSLLLTRKFAVTLIAAHLPGDLSIEYTSPWAGGFWRSHVGPGPKDEEVRGWDRETLECWLGLLGEGGYFQGGYVGPGAESGEKFDVEAGTRRNAVEKRTGLGMRQNVILWSTETMETDRDGSGLWWKDVVWNFDTLKDDELEAANAEVDVSSDTEGEQKQKVVFGVKYDTICINIPQYLLYLKDQVEALGGRFIKHQISTDGGFEGVVHGMKSVFFASTSASTSTTISADSSIHGVVIAAGLAGRYFLPKDEAQKLFPIRGQTVLVKGEGEKALTHIFGGNGSEEELTYVVPRPGSGCTIIGGCKQVGNYDSNEDEALTKRILARAKGLVPKLLDGKGEFEVVSVQVGRRPGRTGGPRVEAETFTYNNERDMKVVWTYGHAGAGYQNSVGSAAKVVRLLEEL